MKRTILFSLLLFSFTLNVLAQENTSNKKIVKTTFWVNGVCEMCQTRIQKAALSTKGVKMANWHIENQLLTVVFNQRKCSEIEIKKNIAAVGHDSEDIKALDEIYEQLHSCCLYDRK